MGLDTAPISKQVKTAAKGVQTQLGAAFKGVNTQIDSTAHFAKNRLGGAFAGIGKMLAGAFAVQKLVTFGQECISLGSDLVEVENVVDSAFPHMEAEVDSFAESCIEGFGMSTKVAKQYLGTFGAMSKSFGFAEKEAFNMSAALTGLAGDVASFYNISTDLAYIKLKSVFSGETETLKDLGVVMTQTALDQYALANGYGKTTSKMTEQEKVALRFRFIQEQLALSSGDFVKTQSSWANQTRILKLRFDELKATIGSSLIAAFNPALQMVNALLTKVNLLAKALQSLLGGSNLAKNTTKAAVSDIADETENVKQSASSAGKALKTLMGFDQLNRLDGGSGSSSTDEGAAMAETVSAIDEANEKLSAFMERLQALGNLFKKGFKIGFASADLDAIKAHTESVKQSLMGIFSSDEVKAASRKYTEAVIFNLGKITGAAGSIGVTIGENLLGGVDFFLQRRGDSIKKSIVDTLDVRTETATIAGDLAVSFAEIFSGFKSEGGKKITASVLSVLGDIGLTAQNIGAKIGRDFLSALSRPFTENADSMKETIEKILLPIGDIFTVLSDGFYWLCQGFRRGYDSLVTPALNDLGKRLSKLWQSHLQPLYSEIAAFLSKLAGLLSGAWQKSQPLVAVSQAWLSILGQLLAPLMSLFGDVIFDGLGSLVDSITLLFRALNLLLDFMTGVFSRDWSRSWNDLKATAGSLWPYIKANFRAETVVNYFSGIWGKVKSKFTSMGAQIGTSMAAAIKSAINNVIGQIQSRINSGIGIINKALSIIPGSGKLSGISLPRLAQGGYVKANTPQLAMIGDNRRYGEIVAPEDKMLEMVLTALKLFKQQEGGAAKQNEGSEQLIELVVNIGDETLARRIIKLLKEENRRGNKWEFAF